MMSDEFFSNLFKSAGEKVLIEKKKIYGAPKVESRAMLA